MKYERENESPLGHIQEIERNKEGWEPCPGYPVVQATGWDCNHTENGNITKGDIEDAAEVEWGFLIGLDKRLGRRVS